MPRFMGLQRPPAIRQPGPGRGRIDISGHTRFPPRTTPPQDAPLGLAHAKKHATDKTPVSLSALPITLSPLSAMDLVDMAQQGTVSAAAVTAPVGTARSEDDVSKPGEETVHDMTLSEKRGASPTSSGKEGGIEPVT